jgi:hypothetical protein
MIGTNASPWALGLAIRLRTAKREAGRSNPGHSAAIRAPGRIRQRGAENSQGAPISGAYEIV